MARLVNQGMKEWGIALYGKGNTIDEARKNLQQGYSFPQTLYMSCGYKDKVSGLEAIPPFNVPCPCGKPNHWIVKYDLPTPLSRRRRLKNFLLRLFSP
jgi:hypothetical protein